MDNTKIWLVLVEGKDFKNVEAFTEEDGAKNYLAAELEDVGTKGQIKTITWGQIQGSPLR